MYPVRPICLENSLAKCHDGRLNCFRTVPFGIDGRVYDL